MSAPEPACNSNGTDNAYRTEARLDQRACRTPHPARTGEVSIAMLMTIVVILLVLWLLGLVTSYTMGGLIHVLLVIAIIVVLVRVISGRKPV